MSKRTILSVLLPIILRCTIYLIELKRRSIVINYRSASLLKMKKKITAKPLVSQPRKKTKTL